jgi:hypothetical protein
MTANLHLNLKSFRQFYPLNRLNSGVSKLDIFNRDYSKPLQFSSRQRRFYSCKSSFDRNFIRLHRLLDSIANHLDISYNSKDRKQPYQYRLAKKRIELCSDLFLFFVVMKVLLDDMAFFVPFYFSEPIKTRSCPDLRDNIRPLSFGPLKEFFLKNEDLDKGFVNILRANNEWTKEISETRNFLVHGFHELSLHNDFWTHSHCALFYEFNTLKNYIPNILTYVAKTYFNFVRFTQECEEHFKKMCEIRFSNFEYFDQGYAYSGGLGKTHLYFAGLGRLLHNRILIRIHPRVRPSIPKILEYFMREENIVCSICTRFEIKIKPSIENHVIISSNCGCGNPLPIPLKVERKFFPHFMDQNQKHIIDSLVPYEFKIKILTL